jgi:hypothetical protein
MAEDVLELVEIDPRSAEATALIQALSHQLAQRYDFANDGSGHFQPSWRDWNASPSPPATRSPDWRQPTGSRRRSACTSGRGIGESPTLGST